MRTQFVCPACDVALTYDGEVLFCGHGPCVSNAANEGVTLNTDVVPNRHDQRSATAYENLKDAIEREQKGQQSGS
jgi:hypothetical protein